MPLFWVLWESSLARVPRSVAIDVSVAKGGAIRPSVFDKPFGVDQE
jgi:hypothetical protein